MQREFDQTGGREKVNEESFNACQSQKKLEEERNQFQQRIILLTEELKRKEDELNLANRSNSALTKDVDTLSRSNNTLQQELKCAVLEKKELIGTLEAKEKECEEVQDKVNELYSSIESLEQELQGERRKREKVETDLDDLWEDYHNVGWKFQEQCSEMPDVDKMEREYAERLTSLNNDNSVLRREVGRLQGKLQMSETNESITSDMLKAKKEEVDRLTRRVRNLEANNKRMNMRPH